MSTRHICHLHGPHTNVAGEACPWCRAKSRAMATLDHESSPRLREAAVRTIDEVMRRESRQEGRS